LTVKIIQFKAPFFLMFQFIDHHFEISAVHAMRSEKFDNFECRFIVLYILWELLCVY